MIRLVSLLLVFALSAAASVDSGAKEPTGERESVLIDGGSATPEQILARYLAVSGRGMARGFSSVARFLGKLPKMNKTASLAATRHTDTRGLVQYQNVLVRSGDTTVQKDIIARFMSGEVDNAADPSKAAERKAMAITPDNYRFKYKGVQQAAGAGQVHVFEVNPKKKRVGLFKGELWLDAETGLTVREAGKFVKSPSVFLKNVEFERHYAILDGVAVPKSLSSNIETRFWGTAILQVEYSDVTFDPELQLTGL